MKRCYLRGSWARLRPPASQRFCRAGFDEDLVRDGDHDGQWERYLTVRDQLRTDASARAAYAARECDLAGRFPSDRGSYTAAKASVVEQLLRIAVDGSGRR